MTDRSTRGPAWSPDHQAPTSFSSQLKSSQSATASLICANNKDGSGRYYCRRSSQFQSPVLTGWHRAAAAGALTVTRALHPGVPQTPVSDSSHGREGTHLLSSSGTVLEGPSSEHRELPRGLVDTSTCLGPSTLKHTGDFCRDSSGITSSPAATGSSATAPLRLRVILAEDLIC